MGKRHGERTSPVPEGLEDRLLGWFSHLDRCDVFEKDREDEVVVNSVRSLGVKSAKVRRVGYW
jgi:hypothetical protein